MKMVEKLKKLSVAFLAMVVALGSSFSVVVDAAVVDKEASQEVLNTGQCRSYRSTEKWLSYPRIAPYDGYATAWRMSVTKAGSGTRLAYCLQPGTHSGNGQYNHEIVDAKDIFNQNVSKYHGDILTKYGTKSYKYWQNAIALAMHYGYSGGWGDTANKPYNPTYSINKYGNKELIKKANIAGANSDGSVPADKWNVTSIDEQSIATQMLVWEFSTGCRDTATMQLYDSQFKDSIHYTGSDAELKSIWGNIEAYYNAILDSIEERTKLPSFGSRREYDAKQNAFELKKDSSGKYSCILEDKNGVLGDCELVTKNSDLSVSKNGNKITVSCSKPITGTDSIDLTWQKGKTIVGEGLYLYDVKSNNDLQAVAVGNPKVDPTEFHTAFYTVNNFKVQVAKYDLDTKSIIKKSGFSFKIKDSKGNFLKDGSNDAVFSTNSEGIATIYSNSLVKGNKYTLVEYEAPYGYEVTTKTSSFKYGDNSSNGDITTSNDVVTIKVYDKKHRGSIIINKTMQAVQSTKTREISGVGTAEGKTFTVTSFILSSSVVGEGAVFEITAAEDIKVNNETVVKKGNNPYGTGSNLRTVGKSGQIVFDNLYPGKYHVVEKKAPVTVDSNSLIDTIVEVEEGGITDLGEEPEDLSVTKNYENGAALVRLKLGKAFYVDDTTDATLREKFSNDMFYITANSFVRFGVYLNQDYKYTDASGKEHIVTKDTLVNLVSTTGVGGDYSTFTNMYRLPLGVKYYIQELSTYPGFKVDTEKYEFTPTVANTKHTFEGYTYTLSQKDGFKGYYRDAEGVLHKASAKDNTSGLFWNVPDDLKVDFVKKASDTGKPLQGAELAIYRVSEDGKADKTNPVYTGTSNSEGKFEGIPRFLKGTYVYEELKAPVGYRRLGKSYTFIIDPNSTEEGVINKDTTIVVPNEVITNGLEINKHGIRFSSVSTVGAKDKVTDLYSRYTPIWEDGSLGGAEFQLIAQGDIKTADGTVRVKDGKPATLHSIEGAASMPSIGNTIITNDNGVAKVDGIYPGTYKLVETKTPEGYVSEKDPKGNEINSWDVTITPDGKAYVFGNGNSADDYAIQNRPVEVNVKTAKIMEVSDDIKISKGLDTDEKVNEYLKECLSNVSFNICVAEEITGAANGDVIPVNAVVDYLEEPTIKMETVNKKQVPVAYFNSTVRLPKGKYYIIEVDVPSGWKLDRTHYEFEVKRDSKDVETINIPSGEAKYITNHSKPGKFTFKKVDADTQEGIAGVEITFYRDAKGTDIMFKGTTGADGLLGTLVDAKGTPLQRTEFATKEYKGNDLPLLLPGVYYYKETKTPVNYVEDKKIYNFTIREDQTGTVDLVLENVRKTMKFGIYKTSDNVFARTEVTEKTIDGIKYRVVTPVFDSVDSEGNPLMLGGAKFDVLLDPSNDKDTVEVEIGGVKKVFGKGAVIQTITTNPNKVVYTVDLPVGKYLIREQNPPTGYTSDVEFVKGTNTQVAIAADKKSATVSLKNAEDIIVVGAKNPKKRVTLNIDKQIKSAKLSDINPADAVKDVVFGIFAENVPVNAKNGDALTKDTLVAVLDKGAYNANTGVVNFTYDKYLPRGKYYVKELATHEYYSMDGTTKSFEITGTEKDDPHLIDVTKNGMFDNTEDTWKLYVYKKARVSIDEPLSGQPIQGAKISIYKESDIKPALNSDGTLIASKYTADIKAKALNIGKSVTDANGALPLGSDFKLPVGTYIAVEDEAPKGYAIDTKVQSIVIGKDAQGKKASASKKYYVTFTDTAVKGSISFTKTGERLITIDSSKTANVEGSDVFGMTTYKPVFMDSSVSGAEFTLSAKEDIILGTTVMYKAGDVVAVKTSGADGKITFDGLYLGKYELVETKAPSQHVATIEPQIVEVKKGNTEVDLGSFSNIRKKSTVKIKKRVLPNDYIDFTGVFDDVKFGLFTKSGMSAYDGTKMPADSLIEEVGCTNVNYETLTADVVFTVDLPYGSYYIKETKTNDKLKKLTTVRDFKINSGSKDVVTLKNLEADATNPEGYFDNAPITRKVSLRKVAPNGDPVKGAVIAIYKDGKEVVKGTTGDDGLLPIPEDLEFPKGNYTYKELSAPEGFKRDTSTKKFKVTGEEDEDEAIALTFRNKYMTGKVVISKSGETFTDVTKSTVKVGSDSYEVSTPVFSNSTLADAEFVVKAAEDIKVGNTEYKKGTEVCRFTTDGEGNGTSPDLFCGKYTIQESKAPDGYKLSAEVKEFTISNASTTYSTNFVNDSNIVKVSLKKLMEKDDLRRLAYADNVVKVRFGLYANESLIAKNGNIIAKDALIEVANCNENGEIAFATRLPMGMYYVKEIKTAGDYILDSDKHEFTVTKDSDGIVPLKKKDSKGNDVDFNNNVKEYNVTLKKVAKDTGKPLANVEFGVYASDDTMLFKGITGTDGMMVITQKYNGETNVMVDVANGGTVMKIIKGTYYYKELSAPNGYKLDDSKHEFSVNEANTGKTLELVMEDDIVTGSVSITKTGDSFVDVEEKDGVYVPKFESNKLAGAEFQLVADEDIVTTDGTLRYHKGDVVGTKKTNANGVVKFTDLYIGKYTLKETKAPTGYKVAVTKENLSVTMAKPDLTYAYDNVRYKAEGAAVVKELEGDDLHLVDTKVEMQKVKFGLFAAEEIKTVDGKKSIPADGKLAEVNADENGKFVFNVDLPRGKYYVLETATSPYYVLDTNKYGFEFTGNKNYTIDEIQLLINEGKVIVNNKFDRKVTIKKVAKDSKMPLKDAEIGVYTESGKEVFKGTTDANGILFENVKYPVGKYYYQELKAPEGYKLDTAKHNFEVKVSDAEGTVYSFTMEDELIKANIVIDKTGNVFTSVHEDVDKTYTPVYTDTYLAGATFEIIADEDIITHDGKVRHHKGDVVDTIVTTSKGTSKSKDLFLGKYVVKETKAPDGYSITFADTKVTLPTKDNELTFTLKAVNDRKKVSVQVVKLFEEDSNKLANIKEEAVKVSFGLFAGENVIAQDGTSIPKDGMIEKKYCVVKNNGKTITVDFDADLPLGKYYVRELSTSDYYQKDETKQDFVVDDKSPVKVKFTVTNKPVETEVTLKKIAYDTKQPLEGAEIAIYTLDGKELAKGVTGADGMLALPEHFKLIKGTYKYKELSAPKGYKLDTNDYTFEVTGNEKEPIGLVFENGLVMGKITISKKGEIFSTVTETDGVYVPVYKSGYLSGAEFTIYANEDVVTHDGTVRYAKGAEVQKITTTDDGKAVSKSLFMGSYLVKETKAPHGYGITFKDKVVTLSEKESEGTVDLTIDATDKRNKVTVKLDKKLEQDSINLIDTKAEIVKVVFGLYAGEDIVAADGKAIPKDGFIEKATANENGEVKFSADLPEGRYYVKELETSELFKLDETHHEFIISLEKSTTFNISAELKEGIKNYPVSYPISLKKVTADTDKPVAGATIEIAVKGGDVIFTGVTKEDGTIDFDKELPIGTYTYRETKAPSGYVRDKKTYEFTITGNEPEGTVIELTIKNDYVKGKLSVNKYGKVFATVDDSDELIYSPKYYDSYLNGAVFGIYADGDIVTPDGTVRHKDGEEVDRITTTGEGSATSKELYLGSYKIKELTAPENYTISDKVVSVTLDPKTVTFSCDYTDEKNSVTVKLHKNMEIDPKHLVDAKEAIKEVSFGLYADEDIVALDGKMIPKDGMIERVYADENGDVIFTAELPDGKYYVKELTTSKYYKLDHAKYPFEVSNKDSHVEDLSKVYKFDNYMHSTEIRIRKVDKSTGKGVEGAEVQITNKEGLIVFTGLSGSDGYFTETPDLPIGNYKYHETKAPRGYVLDTKEYEFSVTGSEADGDVIDLVLEDENLKGSISITKTGERFVSVVETPDEAGRMVYKPNYNDGNLDGAEFEVVAKYDVVTPEGTVRVKAGDVVGTMVTDSIGRATLGDLYMGTYIVRETKAPNGYEISNVEYEVELYDEMPNVEVDPIDNKRHLVNVKFNKNLENDDWSIVDTTKEIVKVIFGLFANEDIVADDGSLIPKDGMIAVVNADVDGNIQFADYLPYGSYYVREMETSPYYVLDDTKHVFDVNDDSPNTIDLNTTDEFKNHLNKTTIDFTKVVSDTNQPLAGAKIQISYGDIVIYEGISGVDGKLANVPELPHGTYTYRELEAPKGYKLDTGVYTFTVDGTVDVIKLLMKNEKGKGSIEITKRDIVTDDTIPDCGIRIYDEKGNVIIEKRTDSNGVVVFDNLLVGKYYYQEFDAPKGYKLNEGMFSFEIKENGEVVKAVLHDEKDEVETPEVPKKTNTPTTTSTPVTTTTTTTPTTTTVPTTQTGDTRGVGTFTMVLFISAALVFAVRKKVVGIDED